MTRALGIESVNSGAAVTPNDNADLARYTRAIFVGVSGNVKLDLTDGSTVTLNAMAAGVLHHIAVRRIYATGTTATNIVAFF